MQRPSRGLAGEPLWEERRVLRERKRKTNFSPTHVELRRWREVVHGENRHVEEHPSAWSDQCTVNGAVARA
jgi:hypothetical protein